MRVILGPLCWFACLAPAFPVSAQTSEAVEIIDITPNADAARMPRLPMLQFHSDEYQVRVLTEAIDGGRAKGVELGELHSSRAGHLFELGRYGEAAEDYLVALDLLPPGQALAGQIQSRLIRALLSAGRYQAAEQQTDRLRLVRGSLDADTITGYERYEIEAYLRAGRYDEAEAAWFAYLDLGMPRQLYWVTLIAGYGERLDMVPDPQVRSAWIEAAARRLAQSDPANQLFHREMIAYHVRHDELDAATAWASRLIGLTLAIAPDLTEEPGTAGGFRTGGPAMSGLRNYILPGARDTVSGSCTAVFDVNQAGWVENVRVPGCESSVLAQAILVHRRDQNYAPLIVDGQLVARQDLQVVYQYPAEP
jgi:tetratricopeptide (TPR) repeat protein